MALGVVLSFVEFQYILCVGSRKVSTYGRATIALFQYILCVGSSFKYLFVNCFLKNFNTSYVSVQVCVIRAEVVFLFNFNTSYVSVQEYFKYMGRC